MRSLLMYRALSQFSLKTAANMSGSIAAGVSLLILGPPCLTKQNGARLHGCAHRFKSETARFAEWLQRISGPFPNEFTHFLNREIGREVLFGDEAQRGFSLCEDCVRGAKANAIQQSIGVQQRLRFFQRALERVNDPCRAFADELAVKSFAPPDLGANQFPFAKGSLRDPGSRHRNGPTNERSENASHCSDDRGIHHLRSRAADAVVD